MGFSVPPCLRLERWALTPPFHPYPALLPGPGGIFSVALSVGAPRGNASRVYPQPNRGYTASRPAVFGLSSLPGDQEERLSARAGSMPLYTLSETQTSRAILCTLAFEWNYTWKAK